MTHAGGAPGELRLTVLLDAAAAGDREAFGRAYSLLYEELSRLARSQRRNWVGNETMSTSVLVHEAYLKLVSSEPMPWEGRRHFFALAAQVMRQVLVNYAEQQRAAKRGGGADAVGLEVLDGADAAAVHPDAVRAHANPPDEPALGGEDEILALNKALEKLELRDARQARIVECRFFAGLSIPATAEALGISAATVKREWLEARTWLYAELAARP